MKKKRGKMEKETKEEFEDITKDDTENNENENDIEIKVEDTNAQVKDLQDKLMRTMAEFDNFRKRTIKEKSGMYDQGVRETLDKLLPVIDNFSRALESIPSDNDLHKGILMIYKQMESILKDIGLEKIECDGLLFDASFHNAVSTVEDANYESGTIIEELQKGYIYKDKVIRHSMVKVVS